MSVLQFPQFSILPDLKPLAVTATVLAVEQRFTERHCPRNSLVQHAAFGVGTVIHCHGHVRHVDFETQITKLAADLTSEERPQDVEPEALVSVSWINLSRHVVSVKSLRELQRKATDKYQRWAS